MLFINVSKFLSIIDFKIKLILHSLFSSKSFLMIPVAIGVVSIEIKNAINLLFFLMIIDFCTGIGASYFKKKKEEKENHNEKKSLLISSEKLKMSGLKFILYTTSILLAYFVENVFFIKPFQISLSSANFTLTILVISFWCLVEFYSILFENFKAMGLDIMAIGFKLIKKYKNVKQELNK